MTVMGNGRCHCGNGRWSRSRGNDLRDACTQCGCGFKMRPTCNGKLYCCDMHNVHCEQGGDECCVYCTETTHFDMNHGGSTCVLVSFGSEA